MYCALIVRVFLMGTMAKQDFISLFPLIAPERRSRASVNPYGARFFYWSSIIGSSDV